MTAVITNKHTLILFMMLGTGIAGCGGSGAPAEEGQEAGDTAGNMAAITTENAVSIARTAIQVTGLLHGLGDIGGNVSSSAYSETMATGPNGKRFNFFKFTATQLKSIYANREIITATKAATGKAVSDLPETSCAGGGVATMQWDDADNNSAFTAGDIFNVAFDNCVDDMMTLDGAFTISHLSVTGDPQDMTQPWELVATLTFDDLTVIEGEESSKVNGEAQLTFGVAEDGVTETGLVSLSTLNHDMDGSIMEIKDYTVNFTNDLNTNVVSMSGRGEIISELGALKVTTLKPLQMSMEEHPSAGRLRIAVDHSVLTLNVASSDSVKLDIDEDGNGIADASVQPNWNQIHQMPNDMGGMPAMGQAKK